MGRMHSKVKGLSSSALPYKRSAPSWCKTSPQDVIEQISKLARKGMTPSSIGVLLRDQSGVPQVREAGAGKQLLCLHASMQASSPAPSACAHACVVVFGH